MDLRLPNCLTVTIKKEPNDENEEYYGSILLQRTAEELHEDTEEIVVCPSLEIVANFDRDPRISCPHCGLPQAHPSDLDLHLRSCPGLRPVPPPRQRPRRLHHADTARINSTLSPRRGPPTTKPPLPRKYLCDQCDAAFMRPPDLRVHKQRHDGVRPHECDQCERAFVTRSELTIHRRVHTGERPYPCSECKAAFASKSALKVHSRIHSGERPYSCSECDATFTTLSVAKAHRRAHAGERPYSCRMCDAKFTCAKSLRVHCFRHTGERPFKCPTCGASFATSAVCRAHQRRHTGERPYKCDQCDAAYTMSGHLATHKRRHNKDYAYICAECETGFVLKSELDRHVQRAHTKSRNFVCNVCKKAYKTSMCLATHMRIHRKAAKTLRRSKRGLIQDAIDLEPGNKLNNNEIS